MLTLSLVAQERGTVSGLVTDKEMNNESLPFANVFVQGTTIGTTTDFDGKYTLSLEEGEHVIVFSFVGYETAEKAVTVVSGQNYIVNQSVGASEGVMMDEVIVRASVSKETVMALLIEQKRAVVIKESIGAQTLSKVGVSDAAGATTKIAGVTKSESSSAIFIRGLGDRYLSTTLNRLPVPSDNIENKNIDLNLFSTSIIENVSISKTYASSGYADQASGSVDVSSKKYSKDMFNVEIGTGISTNVVGRDFRVSENNNDASFGYYNKKRSIQENIITENQGWDTHKKNVFANYGITLSAGKKLNIGQKDLTVFASLSHAKKFDYLTGEFQSFQNNVLRNSFSDTEIYSINVNTTGLLNLSYKLNDKSSISYNLLYINKTKDALYEQGRNGLGEVRDQRPPSGITPPDQEDKGAFVRDQNLKQTTILVNQLLGKHQLSDSNKLLWGIGYNMVDAQEPNRIRNEVNILTPGTDVEIINVGGFDQRKTEQYVKDNEISGFVEDQISFNDELADDILKLNYGLNYRSKQREFNSLFGAAAVTANNRGFTVSSVDNISDAFVQANFDNRTFRLKEGKTDSYNGDLNVLGAYADITFSHSKFSGNLGLRFEIDRMDIDWNVTGYQNPITGSSRIGALTNEYSNFLPSINLKYEIDDRNAFRFAASKTITLPEFKELAPFNYVAPTGRVTTGNELLQKSDNYNFDLKWEFFPDAGELISVTTFYKQIKNPINKTLERGSSGYFTYSNSGSQADVLGVELEGKLKVYEAEKNRLDATFNVTKMVFDQDLLPAFQYKGRTSSALQGASDLIFNTAVSFSTIGEKEFMTTLAANYSSDKLAYLGSPEDFENSEDLYNDEIIEKGFWTLDIVMSKKLTEKLTLKFVGKNLLDAQIEQTQKVFDGVQETVQTVSIYKKGATFSLSAKYVF
jgi:outer membrane receptor protein involved in Fe transport